MLRFFERICFFVECVLHVHIRLIKVLRSEVLWAFTTDQQKHNWTISAYKDNPGPDDLFEWENQLCLHPRLPHQGRVLLAACGRGREIPLWTPPLDMVAFDPVAEHIASVQQQFAHTGQLETLTCGYQTFVRDHLSQQGPFDLVILGWGSLSHVLTQAARIELLQAIRAHSGQALVIASYLLEKGEGQLEKVFKQALHTCLTRWADSRAQNGDHFFPSCGFVHAFTEQEIDELIRVSGYDVLVKKREPYPHVLLAPVTLR